MRRRSPADDFITATRRIRFTATPPHTRPSEALKFPDCVQTHHLDKRQIQPKTTLATVVAISRGR